MFTLRRSLSCAFLLPLAALAGCQALSSDYWHSPSILTTAPPDQPKQTRRETEGGFTVLVEAPGQPTAARAIADIGAFAQRRGFARQSAQPGAERYTLGKITLDTSFRAADSHVVASLHSFGLSRKFAESFYRDFDKEYARQYGEEDPIIETDFGGDADAAPERSESGRGRGTSTRGSR